MSTGFMSMDDYPLVSRSEKEYGKERIMAYRAEYKLSPEQIMKLNRMKHMCISPMMNLFLIIEEDEAKVTGPALEMRITMAEAFKL